MDNKQNAELMPSISFESLGRIVALIGSASLVTSIVYDWGYFTAIGLSFSEIPTSIYDHASSSLLFLPKIIFSFLGLMIFELLSKRIEQGKTEEEITAECSDRMKKFRRSPWKVMPLIALLGLFTFLVIGGPTEGLMVSLIILWLTFASWVHNHPRIAARTPFFLFQLIRYGPPILIWFALTGYSDASTLFLKNTFNQRIFFQATSNKQIQTNVLRAFDKFIIIRDPSRQTAQVIPWSEIRKIEYLNEKVEFHGYLSRWYGSQKTDKTKEHEE